MIIWKEKGEENREKEEKKIREEMEEEANLHQY